MSSLQKRLIRFLYCSVFLFFPEYIRNENQSKLGEVNDIPERADRLQPRFYIVPVDSYRSVVLELQSIEPLQVELWLNQCRYRDWAVVHPVLRVIFLLRPVKIRRH